LCIRHHIRLKGGKKDLAMLDFASIKEKVKNTLVGIVKGKKYGIFKDTDREVHHTTKCC
jgi:uncharacterized protein VirK/YbjX